MGFKHCDSDENYEFAAIVEPNVENKTKE